MTRWPMFIASAICLTLGGCDHADPDAPPQIVYGESVCADCDMIINDDRFASGLIYADERGRPAPLVFDDIGDQIRYEDGHRELEILSRWVRDQSGAGWVRAERAHFVRAEALHTPMASGIAALATRDDASRLAAQHSGVVLTFEELWRSGSSEQAPTGQESDDHSSGEHP